MKRADKKRIILGGLLSLCIGLSLALCGCGGDSGAGEAQDSAASSEPVSREFFAMDTYMTVTAYGENAAEATEAAEAEVNRLDAMLSTGNADSEIAKLNADGEAVLSEEAGALVQRGLEFYDATDGLFDIAIYPVMDAWGFTNKKYRVPSDEELAELLPLIDASKVYYDGDEHSVRFDKDKMAIDLGGMAKGYTSSRIMEIYKEHGIESGLVSLGGNVQVLGTKPDGSLWRVAVQDPGSAADEDVSAQQYMGVLEASDTAVITSGAYERNFTEGGKFYHHIIDPATGRPADSGLKSVTIISSDGTLADALSTSLYIMGRDDALNYWREHKDQFDCILMDEDNELYVTSPIAGQFSSDLYHINVVD